MKQQVTHKYENGQLKYLHNYFNDRLHGSSEGWLENGQMHYQYNFRHGIRYGLSSGWHRSGRARYRNFHLI